VLDGVKKHLVGVRCFYLGFLWAACGACDFRIVNRATLASLQKAP
jgi:hypothetical protein